MKGVFVLFSVNSSMGKDFPGDRIDGEHVNWILIHSVSTYSELVVPCHFIKQLSPAQKSDYWLLQIYWKFLVHTVIYYPWNWFGIRSGIFLLHLNGGQNPPSFVAHQGLLLRPRWMSTRRLFPVTHVSASTFTGECKVTCFEGSPWSRSDFEKQQRALYNNKTIILWTFGFLYCSRTARYLRSLVGCTRRNSLSVFYSFFFLPTLDYRCFIYWLQITLTFLVSTITLPLSAFSLEAIRLQHILEWILSVFRCSWDVYFKLLKAGCKCKHQLMASANWCISSNIYR